MGVKAYWRLKIYDKDDKPIDYTDREGDEIFGRLEDVWEYLIECPQITIVGYRIEIIFNDG